MSPARSLTRRLRRKKPGVDGLAGPMETEFDTPAYRVLRAMLREGTINHRRFTEICRLSPRHSQALRERLTELGYLTEEKSGRHIKIHLTSEGRKMGELSAAAEELDDRLRRKRSGKSG